MHSCLYLQIVYVQGWAKNRLLYSTGFIYIQVRGRGQCHNYRCVGGEGSHARGQRKLIRPSTTWMMKTQNATLLLIQQHHISHTSPLCFRIRSIRTLLLRNTIEGHFYCESVRSTGIESILRLEDLDLIPERFQSRSSGSQAECSSLLLIAGVLGV